MTAIELIAAERNRQISVEGWTPEHDDDHEAAEMAIAAACYALPPEIRGRRIEYVGNHSDGRRGTCLRRLSAMLWPWHHDWWKPSGNRVRDLVKAGALIAAEIERLQRIETGMENSPADRRESGQA